MRDCFGRVVATEGVLSLFNGAIVSAVIYIPTQMLNHAFKNFFRTMSSAFYYSNADRNGALQFRGYFNVLWKSLASDESIRFLQWIRCNCLRDLCLSWFLLWIQRHQVHDARVLSRGFLANFLLPLIATNLAGLASYLLILSIDE